VKISRKVQIKADLGYQGIQKIHPKSKIPFRKPRKTGLTQNQRQYNTRLRRKRVRVEHVIRQCKIFRIVKERYRNKQKNLQIVWSIICGLVNCKS
jgi:IS5 family transposase